MLEDAVEDFEEGAFAGGFPGRVPGQARQGGRGVTLFGRGENQVMFSGGIGGGVGVQAAMEEPAGSGEIEGRGVVFSLRHQRCKGCTFGQAKVDG